MPTLTRGIVQTYNFTQLYGLNQSPGGIPTPVAAIYVPSTYNYDLLIIECHGSTTSQGSAEHLGYYLKQMNGWPDTCTIGSGYYGAYGNGPQYSKKGTWAGAAKDDPIPVPSGLAPVNLAWPYLAEYTGAMVVAPRLWAGGGFTSNQNKAGRSADRNNIRTIVETLLAWGWIKSSTHIHITGHSSGASYAYAYACTFPRGSTASPAAFIDSCSMRHSSIDSNLSQMNGEMSQAVNTQVTWTQNPDGSLAPGADLNAGGTYTFYQDAACKVLPVYCMSGDGTSDGTGGTSWADYSRVARSGWMTTNNFTKVYIKEFVTLANAFTGYDAQLHGPTISGGAGGRYDWADGAHAFSYIQAARFVMALLRGENPTIRFDN